jgi:hypothetical protein
MVHRGSLRSLHEQRLRLGHNRLDGISPDLPERQAKFQWIQAKLRLRKPPPVQEIVFRSGPFRRELTFSQITTPLHLPTTFDFYY